MRLLIQSLFQIPAAVKKLNPYYLVVILTLAGALHLSATPGAESRNCSPVLPSRVAAAHALSDPAPYFTVTTLAPPHEEIIMEETEEVRSSNRKFFDGSHLDIRLLYALTPIFGIHPSSMTATHSLIPPQESLHILFGVLRV